MMKIYFWELAILATLFVFSNCNEQRELKEDPFNCIKYSILNDSTCKKCSGIMWKNMYFRIPNDKLEKMKQFEDSLSAKYKLQAPQSHVTNYCLSYQIYLKTLIKSQQFIDFSDRVSPILDTIDFKIKNKINYTSESILLEYEMKNKNEMYLDSLFQQYLYKSKLNRIILTSISNILNGQSYECFLNKNISKSRDVSIIYEMLLYDLEKMSKSNPKLFVTIMEREKEFISNFIMDPNINFDVNRSLLNIYNHKK